eukprot:2587909-Rhodomonas_salina.1
MVRRYYVAMGLCWYGAMLPIQMRGTESYANGGTSTQLCLCNYLARTPIILPAIVTDVSTIHLKVSSYAVSPRCPVLTYCIILRVPYTIPCVPTAAALSQRRVAFPRIILRFPYAMSGTEIGYAATRCRRIPIRLLCAECEELEPGICLRARYAMSGTGLVRAIRYDVRY